MGALVIVVVMNDLISNFSQLYAKTVDILRQSIVCRNSLATPSKGIYEAAQLWLKFLCGQKHGQLVLKAKTHRRLLKANELHSL